jgi:hypothetical protein
VALAFELDDGGGDRRGLEERVRREERGLAGKKWISGEVLMAP